MTRRLLTACAVLLMAWPLGAAPNFQILDVQAPLAAPQGQAVTVVVSVRATELADEGGTLELLDGEEAVDGAALAVEKDPQVLTVRLTWRPKAAATQPAQGPPGSRFFGAGGPPEVRKLRLHIPPEPAESVHRDNSADLHVLVYPPSIRVLCMDSPRGEQKACRAILESAGGFQTAWLLQTPAGRLFSTGELDGRKFLGPPGADDLKAVDVVVLGRFDAAHFHPAQMRALAGFVQAGGGLLVLGGADGLNAAQYAGTPLEDVLPVRLPQAATRPAAPARPAQTASLPLTTAEGAAHPMLAGVAPFLNAPGGRPPQKVAVRRDERPLPGLTGWAPLGTVRSDAVVLAVRSASDAAPVLVCRSVDQGRSALLCADSTWRWAEIDPGGQAVHARLWQQMLAWTAHAPAATSDEAQALLVARTDRPWQHVGEWVTVQALVRPLPGQNVEKVRLVVQPEGELADRPVELKPAGDGVYKGTFRVKQMGYLGISVTALDYMGKTIAADALRLWAAPSAER
ncbi:MAG: hypothetical protein BWX88_03297 [Planctomycetes bacterium ADurb.Bin126]|nr:MAG: hypothetical protein BWX88_03297 [Planctomycetes bacterium ADurb.Bin126]HOD81609.1 hypothetical protein [Phycisphaerae bacterium]HQL71931.1 hypothetical protein [Phycisphaerae bacterium]